MLVRATVSYIPAPDGPQQTSQYDGSPIFLFGAYKVRFEDGFTYLQPHTGFYNEPLPVDDPEVQQVLIAQAEEGRASCAS